MKAENDFPEKEAIEAMLKEETPKKKRGLRWYAMLAAPILLFPILYFPYVLWWRKGFTEMALRMAEGSDASIVQIMITGNNTIMLFWCLVTAVAMLASIVLSILKVRPWFFIPLYLAVMFSLCGIFSLAFYTAILQ